MSTAADATAGGAGIGLIGSFVSGGIGADAAKVASDAQVAGQQQGLSTEQGAIDQTTSQLMPWQTAGKNALSTLTSGMASGAYTPSGTAAIMQDPGVQYRMDQATNALQTSAAARGRLLSGGTLKSLDTLSQNLASQEYSAAYQRDAETKQTAFNEESSIANSGQQATEFSGQARDASASSQAALYTGIGNSEAAGDIGEAQAWRQGIQGGTNDLVDYSATKGAWGSDPTTWTAPTKGGS